MTRPIVGKLIGIAFLVLLVHGYAFCDFVPATFYLFVSVGLAVSLVAAAVMRLVILRIRSGQGHGDSVFARITAFVLFPALFSVPIWLVIGKSLPGLVTGLVGAPHVEETWMSKWHPSHNRALRCSNRLRGGIMDKTFPGFVCVSTMDYRRLSNGALKVRLSGKQSFLGFLVQHHEIVSDLGPNEMPGQSPAPPGDDVAERAVATAISGVVEQCRNSVGSSAKGRYTLSADVGSSGALSPIAIEPDSEFARCLEEGFHEKTLPVAGEAHTISFSFDLK
jgi:hypothetical protein